MPQSGSNSRRRSAIVILALVAVVAIGVWTLRSRGTRPSLAPAGADTGDARAGVGELPIKSDRDARNAKAAVHLKHAAVAAPLLPPGAPLAQIYDELKARADAGDAAAASRLYHAVVRCSGMRRSVAQMISSELARDTSAMSASGIEQHERLLQYLYRNADRDRVTATMCAGASNEQIGSTIPTMLRAAQLGDLNALDCFIGADLTTGGMLNHPEWLALYKKNAPALIDAAMQRGDWITVELMRHALADLGLGGFDESLRRQLVAADPSMNYRYLRLEQFGAQGDLATRLRINAAIVARELKPQQIADGEAWAQDEYNRYFTGSSFNDVFNGADICEINDD